VVVGVVEEMVSTFYTFFMRIEPKNVDHYNYHNHIHP
jgi:hypothetical protein